METASLRGVGGGGGDVGIASSRICPQLAVGCFGDKTCVCVRAPLNRECARRATVQMFNLTKAPSKTI